MSCGSTTQNDSQSCLSSLKGAEGGKRLKCTEEGLSALWVQVEGRDRCVFVICECICVRLRGCVFVSMQVCFKKACVSVCTSRIIIE